MNSNDMYLVSTRITHNESLYSFQLRKFCAFEAARQELSHYNVRVRVRHLRQGFQPEGFVPEAPERSRPEGTGGQGPVPHLRPVVAEGKSEQAHHTAQFADLQMRDVRQGFTEHPGSPESRALCPLGCPVHVQLLRKGVQTGTDPEGAHCVAQRGGAVHLSTLPQNVQFQCEYALPPEEDALSGVVECTAESYYKIELAGSINYFA